MTCLSPDRPPASVSLKRATLLALPSIWRPSQSQFKSLAVMLVPLLLALGSCATHEANRYYSSVRYPERAPSEVAILTSRPNRDFIVIADFQSRGENAKAMQKKAAKIGADAVIVVPLGGYYNLSDQWANSDSQRDSFSRIAGTAIKYK